MKFLLRSNLSIRHKLMLLVLVISMVLLLFVSMALLLNEKQSLEKNLSGDLNTLAEIMGINSSVGLSFRDDFAVKEVLRSLQVKPQIMKALIFNSEGKLFADYYRQDVTANAKATYIGDYHQAHHQSLSINSQGTLNIVEGVYFPEKTGHIYVIKKITHDNVLLGAIFIQADLSEFNERLYWYAMIMAAVMLASLLLAMFLAHKLQYMITKPVYHLRDTMQTIVEQEDYTQRAEQHSNDELGELIEGFNAMLYGIEKRDQEILSLNRRLKEENQRMGAELEITRQIQQMVLPKAKELEAIQGLDIAAYMSPADEVGGDYYDILCHDDWIKIGIGDVTGHGLESGVIMLMVQTAIRTLLINQVNDPAVFLDVVNSTIFANIQRMSSDKNLTLSLLDYQNGTLKFTGQHEDILILRKEGKIESINTFDYGFMVGLLPDIREFIKVAEIQLNIGDSLVLYTDGITEAFNMDKKMYGIERLHRVISKHWQAPAVVIQRAVIEDVQHFAGKKKFMDDITLLVIKRLH